MPPPAMFGKKCEVFAAPEPLNDTGTDRTTPAIFLGATGDVTGNCRFMSLVTGEEIKGSRFERTRLSQLDIRRVHELAEMEDQPEDFEFYYRDMSLGATGSVGSALCP